MTNSSAFRDPAELAGILGVSIPDELLVQALTHRSFAYDHGGTHYERLEFLGDAILQQAITLELFERFRDLPEGELSKRRAALVSTLALAEVARSIGLGAFLRLGNGEIATGGHDKSSLLADVVAGQSDAVLFVQRGWRDATPVGQRLGRRHASVEHWRIAGRDRTGLVA